MLDFSKKLDIVVIGGSLAGLMVSIPLKRLGHRVTILERSPTPVLQDQGAGLVAGGETQAFFSKHDLSKSPIAVTSPRRMYLDQSGDIIDSEDWTQRMTSWDLLYNIARANFDGVETAYVDSSHFIDDRKSFAEVKYEYGRTVTGIEDRGDKVEIRYSYTAANSNGYETIENASSSSILADYVIAADGPSSRSRAMLLGPQASERTYADYVIFRGTVPETELSEHATAVFVEKFTFFHTQGIQALAYAVPGVNGASERGKRVVSWGWYSNYQHESEEFADLMTDVHGKRHRYTVPTGGKMQPRIWELQKLRAEQLLPPQFAEIVAKTSKPFVQVVTDLEPPPKGTKVGRLLGGKATLAGDALAGFRPHTAAGTSQAALHALSLEKVFRQEMSWEEYESSVLEYAWSWQTRGVMLGTRSQFGKHPLAQKRSTPVERKELHMRKQ